MKDCNCNNHPYKDAHGCSTMEVQELSELPLYDLDSITNLNLLAEYDTLDEATGRVLHSIVRLPINRVVPNGSLENTFVLPLNNDSFEVPEAQPVPAYVMQDGSVNRIMPAESGHKAQFFVLGKFGEGMALCQAVGVINILEGHNYIVSAQYYLSSNGGVTTSASETGQRLFIPVSNTKLLLNLGA